MKEKNGNLSEGSGKSGSDTLSVIAGAKSIISPPVVKGMKVLDKAAFSKIIDIPVVSVQGEKLEQVFHTLKPYLLKVPKIKPVQEGSEENVKKVLLNPEKIDETSLEEFLHKLQKSLDDPTQLNSIQMEANQFGYDNWSSDQILDSILPDDREKVSGFSKVGHLLHLNLRDHLLDYKKVIGEVLLDKVPNTRSVVNKVNIIDSTFRNFQMEVLAGDADTIVTVRHSKCEFQFDFAKVYWNPRLATEHERVHKFLKKGDTLYDVFAGVGPFAVPAGKKRIRVLANDLNPDSYKWLQHNIKKNKVTESVQAFNLDGREFINTVIKEDLIKQIQSKNLSNRFHITMNLPALAVEFLDAFWSILTGQKMEEDLKISVHVYCFVKDAQDFKAEALQLVKDHLRFDLQEENVQEVFFVRRVAPNKEMYRVSFYLPQQVLTQEAPTDHPRLPRKRKLSEDIDDTI